MAGRRVTRGRFAAVVVGVAMVAAAFTVASPSHATFPGANGLIAYVQNGNIFVVNPNNPVPTQVTNTGNFTNDVNYNATGNKLVADSSAGFVLLDPVAGSTVTPVPNTTGADFSPAFNPDGTRLAFHTAASLATIDVGGTNRTQININGFRPEWSPDGTFLAYHNNTFTQILRTAPTGGNQTVLATTGPAGAVACTAANFCVDATVSPDSKSVVFAQAGAGNGLAKVNADGSTVTPQRLTTAPAATNDLRSSYSPDGTKVSFDRSTTGLSTVPTDGSGTVTAVGGIGPVVNTAWGPTAGTGTGTGTGTGVASVISVTATRTGANCVFNIVATPAAAGVTVDFSITNNKGVVKLSGNDVSVPASPSIKAKKRGRNKVRNITLTDPKGATLGTSTATCAK